MLKTISNIKKDYKKHGCKLHDDHNIALAMVGDTCEEINDKYQALINKVLADKTKTTS